MQDYARGITENRFEAACNLSNFDPAGKLKRERSTTDLLEFTKGVFRGSYAEDAAADWNATWHIRGNRKTIGLELHTDDGALFPVFVFSPARRKQMLLDAATRPDSSAVTVSYRPAEACQSFKPQAKAFSLADIACGTGLITFDRNAPIPLRATFEGAGLPIINGKESMQYFHVNSEFESVTLPGAKRPFLFPNKVTADFGFGEGRVTVQCEYRLHKANE